MRQFIQEKKMLFRKMSIDIVLPNQERNVGKSRIANLREARGFASIKEK